MAVCTQRKDTTEELTGGKRHPATRGGGGAGGDGSGGEADAAKYLEEDWPGARRGGPEPMGAIGHPRGSRAIGAVG